MKFSKKTCQSCGKLFMPTGGRQMYCNECTGIRTRLSKAKCARKNYAKKKAEQFEPKQVVMSYYDIINDMKAERFSAKTEVAEIKKELKKINRNNLIIAVSSVVALVAILILFIVK